VVSKLSPDAQVRAWSHSLAEIRKEQGEAAYWRGVRNLCLKSPWFITRVVLQYHWMDEDLHGNHLLGFYERNVGKDTAVFIPRGHGKTLTSASRIIHKILNNPNISLMYASATEPLAENFCAMVGKELISNDYLLKAFPDILPQSKQDVDRWGKDGYSLPNRRPRIDPTLFSIGLGGNPTGKHPDEIFIDDTITLQNNNEAGYRDSEDFLKECKLLLSPQGVINLTGTRWDDGDPYGKIIEGKLHGRQGKFETMILSCFEDDNPRKPPIYPLKKRWNSPVESGYSHESLLALKAPESEGGMGATFDAQMRNDPAPEERQDIKVGDINIYDPETAKIADRLGDIRSFGIEILGGGGLISGLVREKCDAMKFDIPLQEVGKRQSARGKGKEDTMRATLEPTIREGRLFAQQWMIGDPGDSEGLGYEIRRLGVAKHDDIVDCLSMIISDVCAGSFPAEDMRTMDVYIGADLAFTEKVKSDWTVVMAVAVDSKRNYWILDYDRFQISAATALADRLIAFFRKWSPEDGRTTPRQKKRNFAVNY